jgi:RNA polymerase sigma factor (sigma-70 family)
MTKGVQAQVFREFETLFSIGTIDGFSDGQLLTKFGDGRDETAERAFATLVERHGPMVMRVCRAILRDEHEAEDAFQATFLVLARKARSLWVRDSLGPWVHGVACRIACRARTAAARRRRQEQRGAAMATTLASSDKSWDDLAETVHEEVGRLPESYRAAVVMCDLEGHTQEQAARRLGWPLGTLQSRLARGRDRLRNRLIRRGLSPTAGLLAIVLSAESASSGVTAGLAQSTLQNAMRLAAGGPAAMGTISAPVAALVERTMTMMLITKLKIAAGVILAVGALTGAGLVAAQERESRDRDTARAGERGSTERPDGERREGDRSQSGIVDLVAGQDRESRDRDAGRADERTRAGRAESAESERREDERSLRELKIAEAQLEQRKAELNKAEAEFKIAESKLTRLRRANKVIANAHGQEDMSRAEVEVNAAKAENQVKQAEIREAEARIELARRLGGAAQTERRERLPMAPPEVAGARDRRLEEMDRKLNQILEQLDGLRRDLHK